MSDIEALKAELVYWQRVIGDRMGAADRRFSDMVRDLKDMLADAPETKQPDLERIAKSLASMLTEYVEGGIKSNQNWRNGLNEIVLARLRRLLDAPVPSTAMTASAEPVEGEWTILDVKRALYVDRGRDVILCDHDIVGTDGGTLLVKLRQENGTSTYKNVPTPPSDAAREALADDIAAERERLAGRITPSVWRLMDEAIKLLRNCDCQNPEPKSGVALVSEDCPYHNELAPALSAAPVSAWHPIETAPKDENILAIRVERWEPVNGFHRWIHSKIRETHWLDDSQRWDFNGEKPPTHWMPRPEPPVVARNDDQSGGKRS